MQKILFALLKSAVLGALTAVSHAGPVLNEAGNLQALLEAFPIPSAASGDRYRLPTTSERTAFRAALREVLAGDLAEASDFAASANYEVVSYADTATSDTFTLLREKNSNQHWGGLYVIDQTPERGLVMQCPHPLYDGVRVPTVDVFMDTNAVAYLQAGTHRNNSPDELDCDGGLGGDPYRVSDMAHSPETLFQDAHKTIEAHFAGTVSLSFHGMADDSDPSDVAVSNGTAHEFIGNSLSRDIAARMSEILAAAVDPRVAVSHQEPGENPGLSGSTNVQGRVTNGSPEPCQIEAPTAIFPERFIHMECDPDVRSGAASNWAFVTQTLNDLIPLFSDPAPDRPLGDLVITEAMFNPDQVGDATGEYLELFNHTAKTIDMSGWRIGDSSGNSAVFSGVIQPGDLFVVGVSGDLNGGAAGGAPDAVWADSVGDLTLTNSGDAISIVDGNGDLVASFACTDGDPYGAGVAFELAVGNAHLDGQTTNFDSLPSAAAFGGDTGSPGVRGETEYPLFDAAVSVAVGGGVVNLTFETARAATYGVWKSGQLTSWAAHGGVVPLVGDGGEREFSFAQPGNASEFYQVRGDYAAPR